MDGAKDLRYQKNDFFEDDEEYQSESFWDEETELYDYWEEISSKFFVEKPGF